MSRIPQEFIDDLLNRLDIVEVIDTRVKLKKTGKNYSACCPFHKEKTPSFSVSPDKQFYYCFGCGASGSAIGFVMEYEHLGFIDAVESLAGNLGLSVPKEAASSPKKRNNHNLYELLDKVKSYYQQQLSEHPKRVEAVNYLKNRGLDGVVAKRFGLGFAAPGWDNLLTKFGLNEFDRQQLELAGLTVHNPDSGRTYDRFRHRIMFPIVDVRGRTIGFGGRILSNAAEPQRPSGKDKGAGPKYLNSPETPIFHKGKELYGLHQALQQNRKLQSLLVVEGYMDVIALAQFGIDNAVATLGTACGEDHLRLAFRHTSNVIFCFDGDNAGRKAAKRALENALPTMSDGRRITFLFLPEGQDPDTLVRQIGAERFRTQLDNALPLETFLFEAVSEGIDTRTMDGRARMSKLAAPLLNQLPPGVYRELMFDELAKRTGLGMDTIQELIHTPSQLNSTPPEPASAETAKPLAPLAAEPPVLQPASGNSQANIRYTRPPSENAPTGAATKRAEASKRTLISPARLATTILLESPELVVHVGELDIPQQPDNPDNTQLHQLLAFLKERPQTTFHSILGYWAGQYGLEAQQQLTQLVANQFLNTARKSAPYNSERELMDACQRIIREQKIRQYDQELAELSRQATLNDEQKQRLRELLNLKQQNGRVQNTIKP